jgi:hypothetical protein
MEDAKTTNRIGLGIIAAMVLVLAAVLVYYFLLRSQPATELGFPKN